MNENQKKMYLMQTLTDKHPKLIKGLNNPNQTIPAYMVFQSQDPESCYLRDDLKDIKASSFVQNYGKELQKPLELLNNSDNEKP